MSESATGKGYDAGLIGLPRSAPLSMNQFQQSCWEKGWIDGDAERRKRQAKRRGEAK